LLVSLATDAASPDRENEDFVAATPDATVLLDGAGVPAGSESGCVHGVPWYVRELGVALLTEMTQDAPSLARCLAASIDRVRSLHDGRCDVGHAGSPGATVVLVHRHGQMLDYLVLADSVLLLDRAEGGPLVITDDREARVGRELRRRMDSLATGTPEHAQAYRDYVETLRSLRNQPGGYWVASGDPAAAEQAVTGSIPLGEVRSIALLSDGASRLVDRFQLASWPELLHVLRTGGPHELIRRVRAAEDSDPRGERWPRGKHHDDATAAHLTGLQPPADTPS
jgi:hypothetical protein